MFKKSNQFIRLTIAVAVLLSMVTLSSTSRAQSLPEITFSFPGGVGVDQQAVNDALNTVVGPKIGATVKLNPIDWGSYDQKMKLSAAAGETCDIEFTAGWINNYNQNVAQGTFLALDDLLPKVTPTLYASMPQSVWDGSRVQNKIYQVTTEIMWVKDFGFYVRKDLADKYKLDVSTIKGYADLEPFLATLKKNEPTITPAYLSNDGFGEESIADVTGGYDTVDGNNFAVVKYNDPSLKVISHWETPEFKASVELQRKWYQAGYFPQDLQTRQDTDALMKAGKFGVQMGRVIKPGSESEEKGLYGYDWYGKSLAQVEFINTDNVTAGFSICKTSKNPEAALKFLELLHTDANVFNIVAHGVQGKHWMFVDEAKKVIGFPTGVTAANVGYAPAQGWMWGNQFLEYYIDASQVGSWDATKVINKSANASVALGFSLNPDPIKAQLAQLAVVDKQYGIPLRNGQVDPATALPEYIAKLKEAGLDSELTEVQKQLDAWKASKSAGAAATAAATAAK